MMSMMHAELEATNSKNNKNSKNSKIVAEKPRAAAKTQKSSISDKYFNNYLIGFQSGIAIIYNKFSPHLLP